MTEPEVDFQRIYHDFHPKILRYLTRMVGEDEAEDLTQEVFVKVDRALKTFRGDARISTWIYQIATHAALDRLRSRSSREQRGKAVSVEDIPENDKDLWSDEAQAFTEKRVIRREMSGCIREIIETLPIHYRSVIVLSELEEFSDQEIAAALGLSLETTKMRLHRGRAILKKELSTACIFYRDERNEFACDRKRPDNPLIQIKTPGES